MFFINDLQFEYTRILYILHSQFFRISPSGTPYLAQSYLIIIFLTHLFSMHFSLHPENIRKLTVFCFQGLRKGALGMNGLTLLYSCTLYFIYFILVTFFRISPPGVPKGPYLPQS